MVSKMNTATVKKTHILMVDDDIDLNRLLTEYLAKFGHSLITATTAARGMVELRKEQPDLVILDIMLPDTDGLTLCREIRSEFDVPIIMLTARGEVADRVLGLELGADDYLSKPFEPRELAARIQSVIRRSQAMQNHQKLLSDGLSLEKQTRRVSLDGSDIDLTSMEFELLSVLMESQGRVLSRNRLIERLRGIDADVYDRSIDMLVSRLRDKLGDDSHSPRFIKTVRLTGYQFVGKQG
jgi:DNA-binding response OmpR family regulator